MYFKYKWNVLVGIFVIQIQKVKRKGFYIFVLLQCHIITAAELWISNWHSCKLEKPLVMLWFKTGCPFVSQARLNWGTKQQNSQLWQDLQQYIKRIFWPNSNKTTLDSSTLFYSRTTFPITMDAADATKNLLLGPLWVYGTNSALEGNTDSNGKKCSFSTGPGLEEMLLFDSTEKHNWFGLHCKHYYKIIYVIDYFCLPVVPGCNAWYYTSSINAGQKFPITEIV